MAVQDLVIRSKLIPPRQRRGIVARPRLEAALEAALDYPVVLAHAGTGYGKSTALAALAGLIPPLAWYTISEPDRDPLFFAAHLICAFEDVEPAGCVRSLDLLQATEGRVTVDALTPLLNGLAQRSDRDIALVLDDYHLVGDVKEIADLLEWLVDYAPPNLHIIISTRQLPPMPALNRWTAKGRLLKLTRAELAFTAEEIQVLFSDAYDCPITPLQAGRLARETEGWAIALQMVGQGLLSGVAANVDDLLGRLPSTLDALFDYLASDVLARQPESIQRFLVTTSVLREMEGSACDHLLDVRGSEDTLRRLHEDGLFVVSLAEAAYRYQRLFHDFLRSQLRRDPERYRTLHRRAAAYYQAKDQPEESILHWLDAGDHEPAATLLEDIGADLVQAGRLDSLSSWIGQLPEETRSRHPALDLLLGDVLRLRAQFDDALARYQAAEAEFARNQDREGRSRSLRGQAQVYVDTVRPLKADSLLEDALRLLEPQVHRDESATLLDLLAENKLNLGLPDVAQALHHEASLLRTEAAPSEPYVEARAMLRTGRLAEAQQLLERRAEQEEQQDPSRPQRFHRETLLLLSLIHALQGDATSAERRAREGIAIGQRLRSDFVEAVGYMRLGHASQLGPAYPWDAEPPAMSSGWWNTSPNVQQARSYYQRAIDQVQTFNVMRTYVEPLWGLCRVEGYGGNLALARHHADEAIELGTRAGDEWICDLVRVTMGASYALQGLNEQARNWLTRATEGFAGVGDPFGQAAAELWLALNAWWSGDPERALEWFAQLAPTVRGQQWERMLVERTFLGLRDEQAALPLLIEARKQGIEELYLGRLLHGLGLADAEFHPGYTLWVRTLGPLALWRGDALVTDRDWEREKARQVFQLLLTQRGQWFQREQIVERLWPHLAPDAADRDFRVALNSLSRTLEPSRPRHAPTFFVARRGSVYGLNPAAAVVVDADIFERLASTEEEGALRQALTLYRDYLPDCLYADWTMTERDRLRNLYLSAAERLARHLLSTESWQEAIRICEEALRSDRCREVTYRLLMRAHAGLGDQAGVHGAYQRCVSALREELDLAPSQSSRALLEKLG